jgi:hypothetical protein
MHNHSRRRITPTLSTAITICAILSNIPQTLAQNPALQEKLAQIKQSSVANKQALAHYTWLEQQTISLKGEVKKTQQFQVRIGPDGQQQKTELNPQPPPEPSGGRVKRHIVEKKTGEFEAYGQQIAALGKQYSQLDPQALQQAYQQGNISMQPNGAAGTFSLIIKSYLKSNDYQQQKAIQSLQVASYLTDPSDAVTIAVQFAKLPDGTNHVATNQVNGVSKQLGVLIQNSAYQPAQ